MSGRILIVDDSAINLKLLEARLTAEYFDVVQASNGEEALAICRSEPLDLVLSDVMMPEVDGFELCRALKSDPRTTHLPVVLITALDQPSDRVRGLEAGADDFLTKPVRDLPLFSRVRSLTRLKQMTDELRRRADTATEILTEAEFAPSSVSELPEIVVVSDHARLQARIARSLQTIGSVREFADYDTAFAAVQKRQVMLTVVDLVGGNGTDPIRFLARCRASEKSRGMPIIAITAADDDRTAAKALEIGAYDYVQRPVDCNELVARSRTQLARFHYGETLRMTLERTLELAVIDGLTGLHNRRFLNTHMSRAVTEAERRQGTFSLIVADIDHFKRINDTYGHDGGDIVLREFARRLEASVRASDLPCRIGGEEFAVLLPNADERTARVTAERFRAAIEARPFIISDALELPVTVSVGLAIFPRGGQEVSTLMRAADAALYRAKSAGRNQIAIAA
ncbi:putative transcription regulator (with tandem n-terminal response regulator domains) protein [Fulvimarina pelagi HTCC2506]|uniref:diguanylate cyclase n=2 Tax=Fulvimarina pelagi TaxID=217511 RepID=Q0FZ72_9HYPH|nr:PleD family two-component system response regulator [Fulvimarina pelagi]EAU40406.1 putative transcription regulator (with tandem n-terminal response regulator domains) protein [Fulvimarina pelagi HTCC2506]BAT31440.1 putative transcriptional regulator protein [Fulvimarina pelagi]